MAEVLASAFAGDPSMRWFIPDERRREPLLRAYFRDVIGLYEARVADGGVALWAPPGAWPPHAGSERSRDLYLRHGWAVTERFELPFGGPPLWRMLLG